MSRSICMPNHKTFEMKPVKLLFQKYPCDKIIDPFPFPYQRDALEYLKSLPYESTKQVRFDPPYTLRQLKEKYDDLGMVSKNILN